MRSKDRTEVKSLIKEDVGSYRSLRDNHFEICWTYNYGDDYWYIAHDGKEWNIDNYLKPSQNQFRTMEEAIKELKEILYERNKESLPVRL